MHWLKTSLLQVDFLRNQDCLKIFLSSSAILNYPINMRVSVMLNLFQHLTSIRGWIDPDTSQAILSLVTLAGALEQEEGTSSG